jgi:PPM family protein phosphatase
LNYIINPLIFDEKSITGGWKLVRRPAIEHTTLRINSAGILPTMEKSVAVHACSKTHPGIKRQRNEDTCAADIIHRSFMVADGMGGTAGGEVASALFLEAVCETFVCKDEIAVQQGIDLVRNTFLLANSKIQKHAAINRSHKGLGCTAELLTLCGDQVVLGHVGDSRTYCLHNHRLTQLTLDHSIVQEQIDLGLITEDQAKKSRLRNVLTRAVGVGSQLAIDITCYPACLGDIYLLCTDGLYGMVGDEEILPVLGFDAPLSLKAEILINLANEAGGKDNVSVTLVEILKSPL